MTPDASREYGLLAIGKQGRFTVEILEQMSNASRLMSIETDSWSFMFALGDRDPAEILTHLREESASAELKVGLFLDTPVILVRTTNFVTDIFLRLSKTGIFWNLCSLQTDWRSLLKQ